MPGTIRCAFVVALLAAAAAGGDLPYPEGRSEHELEGLPTTILVPDGISKEKPASMIVLLHGQGDTGANLSHSLAAWRDDGYLVVAPSATEGNWDATDLKKTLAIAAHVKQVMPVDPARVHCMGFSNGGWNLAPIAFDDGLRCCSAVWIAAGYKGGSVPKWAKKGMGVLAVAGTEDPNAPAARETVPMLEDKVRSAEVRLQPGVGHAWPTELMAYVRWWQGAQEGRFVPGLDWNFDWTSDVEDAVQALAGQKRGGIFVYVYAKEDTESAEARALQNEVFLDPLVRHFGNQLQAVKLAAGEESAALGVKATPAVAVLDRTGKVKKILTGKIKAKTLASALRAVAPDRRKPK